MRHTYRTTKGTRTPSIPFDRSNFTHFQALLDPIVLPQIFPVLREKDEEQTIMQRLPEVLVEDQKELFAQLLICRFQSEDKGSFQLDAQLPIVRLLVDMKDQFEETVGQIHLVIHCARHLSLRLLRVKATTLVDALQEFEQQLRFLLQRGDQLHITAPFQPIVDETNDRSDKGDVMRFLD